jgi:hypothetical protein
MERVIIGREFLHQPRWKVAVGVFLIYLPLITTIPFATIAVLLIRTHLRYVGAQNVHSYWSFVPSWVSHRYRYDNQITYTTGAAWYNLRSYRLYWLFNCKLYCPLSVALFSYLSYLVKVVENWWCPFGHDRKASYGDGAIDRSYWHLHSAERASLHPDDRDNPMWNGTVEKGDGREVK